MIQKIFIFCGGILSFVTVSYASDVEGLLGQAAQIYGNVDVSDQGLTAGFSLWGMVGGLLFGAIGFVAFVYGKKNAEFRPMVIGALLMGYPYFVRGTVALYLVGVVLTSALYFFRE